MNNSSNSSAYIEIDTLEKWNLLLKDMNLEAKQILDSYLNTVNDLEHYMVGNVASGFIKDTTDLVTNAKNGHSQMQNVEDFLIEVINTMSAQ